MSLEGIAEELRNNENVGALLINVVPEVSYLSNNTYVIRIYPSFTTCENLKSCFMNSRVQDLAPAASSKQKRTKTHHTAHQGLQ